MQNIPKPYIGFGLVAVVLFVALLVVPPLILGGTPKVSLRTAPPLSGEIAQAIGVGGSGKLPVAGKDFRINSVKYFAGTSWALASIQNLASNNSDSAYVVLEQQAGIYQVVLGPGTAFDKASTKAMPTDLVTYLNNRGVLYASVN